MSDLNRQGPGGAPAGLPPVGDPFGTGQDSVIINDTSGNRTRAVRRVLGKDAIIAARILFALAFLSVGLVVVAALGVI